MQTYGSQLQPNGGLRIFSFPLTISDSYFTGQFKLTTELATIIMMQEKYVPMRGVSEEGGCMSETTFMKKVRDMRIVISKVTFSPDSGGK